MDLFNKKEKEKEPQQEDQVPASGNNKLSQEELEKMYELDQIEEKAEAEAKKLGKFFSLDIGESTRVIINFKRTETFKVKTKSGDLVEQFRYYLIDQRYPDREKQFDTWWNVSKAIKDNIRAGHSEMTIRCVKNNVGGRKYVVVPYTEE